MRNAIYTVVLGIFLSLLVGAAGRDQFDGKWAVAVTSDDGKTYDEFPERTSTPAPSPSRLLVLREELEFA